MFRSPVMFTHILSFRSRPSHSVFFPYLSIPFPPFLPPSPLPLLPPLSLFLSLSLSSPPSIPQFLPSSLPNLVTLFLPIVVIIPYTCNEAEISAEHP